MPCARWITGFASWKRDVRARVAKRFVPNAGASKGFARLTSRDSNRQPTSHFGSSMELNARSFKAMWTRSMPSATLSKPIYDLSSPLPKDIQIEACLPGSDPGIAGLDLYVFWQWRRQVVDWLRQ